MIKTILIVWFFLTLPIVYGVNKKLKGTENEFVTHSFMFQIVLVWKAFWNVPMYYFLVITSPFINKK
jgi:hypothetical protein